MRHDPRVGQASDEASSSVGQAGAGNHDGQVRWKARRSGQICRESHRVTDTEPDGPPPRSTRNDTHRSVAPGGVAGRMLTVPRPHPQEFRDDVVAVARRGEAPLSQIAKDFGISESCLRNWLRRADVDDGHRPGQTSAESAELRELKRRNRLLEQENEVLRRAAAYLSQANLPGKGSTRS